MKILGEQLTKITSFFKKTREKRIKLNLIYIFVFK